MSKPTFPYSEKYDEENQRIFEGDKPDGSYHCVNCEREVSLDESFSNQGKNMICIPCSFEKAKELNMDRYEFLNKEVWSK